VHGLVSKRYHEIRDPIHGFITLDSDERRVLDSPPVQRLRDIHQLAMSYLVYPGATHKRFEHSLGIMELAGRVFDVVTAQHNIHVSAHGGILNLTDDERAYWRKVLRMAALCHDIGHLPFSHAAEKELLPDGVTHETLTAEIIQSNTMSDVWSSMRPPLAPKDVAKIAVGKGVMLDEEFSGLDDLLSDIITGDALGVDRMDYLLRDSHHAGVAYGRFDHYRLIDTMRVLSTAQSLDQPEQSNELGIESGGIHASEGLLLARYFMFMQVYYHSIRLAYDLHLQEFLQAWLDGDQIPISEDGLPSLTDVHVLAAISEAAREPSAPGYEHASRITERNHFKPVYTLTPEDAERFQDPLTALANACAAQFGADNVRKCFRTQSAPTTDFPVVDSRGKVSPSHTLSRPLKQIPLASVGYVLIEPTLADNVQTWLESERDAILSTNLEGG
jgi:HD superfamily phosphohydrolase